MQMAKRKGRALLQFSIDTVIFEKSCVIQSYIKRTKETEMELKIELTLHCTGTSCTADSGKTGTGKTGTSTNRVPELGNWYSCGTQIFSLISHLLRDFFLEIGNIDSKDRSFY